MGSLALAFCSGHIKTQASLKAKRRLTQHVLDEWDSAAFGSPGRAGIFIARTESCSRSFAPALQTASRDSALRDKAQQFAKAIAKEDGVGAVVAWVRSYL
ncbi:MAG TPA: hypothetical protein PK299_15600 [Anaerolineales bacterium]|nr:hypothetical protein [Anaerolineales bacterium]